MEKSSDTDTQTNLGNFLHTFTSLHALPTLCLLLSLYRKKKYLGQRLSWVGVLCSAKNSVWRLTNSRCVGLCNLHSRWLLQPSNPSPFGGRCQPSSMGMPPWIPPWWWSL